MARIFCVLYCNTLRSIFRCPRRQLFQGLDRVESSGYWIQCSLVTGEVFIVDNETFTVSELIIGENNSLETFTKT